MSAPFLSNLTVPNLINCERLEEGKKEGRRGEESRDILFFE